MKHLRDESGFSLVELMIAVVILTVGILGFASTTGFMFRQSTMAELRVKRMAAVVNVVEGVKAQPFASVTSGSRKVGEFSMSWTSTTVGVETKIVQIISNGPGVKSTTARPMPGAAAHVIDTFTYQILKP
jgi:prepilin-type N-terminal cleavage/methylation domain-containing protein